VSLAALALAGTGNSPASAAPERGPAARQCSLSPSPAARHSEWASCFQADAKLSAAPRVGETARLTFSVRVQGSHDSVRVQVDLPAGLEWVKAPRGFSTATRPAKAPQDGGRVNSAVGTRSFDDSGRAVFRGTVRAVQEGPAQIRVRAGDPSVPGPQGDASVFLTVGGDDTAPSLTIASPKVGSTTPVPESVTPRRATPKLPYRSAGTEELAKPHSDDKKRSGGIGAQALSCVRGSWNYVDNTGVTRPAANFQVQAWDSDFGRDDLLASGLTDGNGGYRLCFDNDDSSGGQDVFVRFVAENGQWSVQRDDDEPYTYVTGTRDDVGDGTTTDFGALQPGRNEEMRALHAYDSANDAAAWTPGDCWDARDTDCRQIRINWTPTSTMGTYYCTEEGGDACPRENEVYLMAADPDAPSVVVHEIGHAVMDDVYEDNYPATPNCNPHEIQRVTSAGCAWSEGFAEWYPASVYDDPFFRWPDGNAMNLEDPTWGTAGWGQGDQVEGRVAGAMIDISDSGNENEQPWDVYGEAPAGNLWSTFLGHRSATFAEFWRHRAADGFNTADADARSSVYQNTIDYDFRNPLRNYTPLTRPMPQQGTPHNYHYDTTTPFWSVVAVRPEGNSDQDLWVYDDRAQTQSLAASVVLGNGVDFVAVDSNRRPLGDYYPRVSRFTGGDGYRIELAQGSGLLRDSEQIIMGAGDVVAVRDTVLTQGEETTITVTSSDGGQNPELFLMGSTDDQSTWVRPRSSAVASATGGGAGAAERVTFTAPATGVYGVVVVNRTGAGTYTLARTP
jgi:hypothetical protein